MKKILSITVLGFILGSVISVFFLSPKKNYSELKRKPSSEVFVGKNNSLFEIKISAPQGIPTTESTEFTLVATIDAMQKVEGKEIYFQWVLPPGVSHVGGVLSDSLSSEQVPLKGGTKPPIRLELAVEGIGKDSEPKTITLQVYTEISTEIGDMRLGSVGVFSNRPNDVLLSPSSDTFEKTQGLNTQSVVLPKAIQQ